MVQQQLKECGSKNKPPLPGRELYTGPRGELQDHGRGYNTYRGKKTYRAACAFEYLILMGVKPKREQWLNQEMPF